MSSVCVLYVYTLPGGTFLTAFKICKWYLGALEGGSPCRLSISRNANVACLCRLFMPMSHVEFKKRLLLCSLNQDKLYNFVFSSFTGLLIITNMLDLCWHRI